MMNERDGADSAMEEAARLELDNARLRKALGRVRQGYLNILDVRRFEFGDEFRYGALTRREVEDEIKLIDAALGGLLTPVTPVERCPESRWQPHGVLHPSDCPICEGTGWVPDGSAFDAEAR